MFQNDNIFYKILLFLYDFSIQGAAEEDDSDMEAANNMTVQSGAGAVAQRGSFLSKLTKLTKRYNNGGFY